MEDDNPVCRYFKEKPSIGFTGNEVLIREEVCKQQKEELAPTPPEGAGEGHVYIPTGKGTSAIAEGRKPEAKTIERLRLRFVVPKGKVSNLMGVLNLLQTKFARLEIEVLTAEGEITEQEYEDKIKEAFRQMGIELDERE